MAAGQRACSETKTESRALYIKDRVMEGEDESLLDNFIRLLRNSS